MKYLDSNIFLYPVIYPESDKKAAAAKSILLEIANGKGAFTSALTWDEVCWVCKKHFGLEKSILEGKRLIEFPSLFILQADDSIISEAQKIVEKYKLDPRDALHAATSIRNGASEFVTADNDFLVVKELNVKLI